jgi:hypothetical protein
MAFNGVRSSWLILARNWGLVLASGLELVTFFIDFTEQARILHREYRLRSPNGRGAPPPSDRYITSGYRELCDLIHIRQLRSWRAPRAATRPPRCPEVR